MLVAIRPPESLFQIKVRPNVSPQLSNVLRGFLVQQVLAKMSEVIILAGSPRESLAERNRRAALQRFPFRIPYGCGFTREHVKCILAGNIFSSPIVLWHGRPLGLIQPG